MSGGRPPRPTVKVDVPTGLVVRREPSEAAMARAEGVSQHAVWSQCAQRRAPRWGFFAYRHEDDHDPREELPACTAVLVSGPGGPVALYPSAAEAALGLRVHPDSVNRAVKGGGRVAGMRAERVTRMGVFTPAQRAALCREAPEWRADDNDDRRS